MGEVVVMLCCRNVSYILIILLASVSLTAYALGFFDIKLGIVILAGMGLIPVLNKIPEALAGLVVYSGAVKAAPFLDFLQGRIDLTLLSGLLIMGYIFYLIMVKKQRVEIDNHLLIMVLFLAFSASISILYFPLTSYGVEKYFKFIAVSIGMCLFTSQLVIKDSRSIEKVFYFIVFLSSVIGVYALFTHTRESFASNYLFVARIMGTALIISLFFIWNKVKYPGKLFVIILSLFLAYVMLASGARGPTVAFAAACVLGTVVSLVSNFTIQKAVKSGVIVLTVTALFLVCIRFGAIPDVFIERMSFLLPQDSTFDHGASYTERVEHIWRSLEIMSNHPALGVGIGSYAIYSGSIDRDYPHNIFLEFGCEFGLPVLCGFFVFISVSYMRLLTMIFRSKHNRKYCRSLLITLFTLLTFMLCCAQFSGDVNDNKDLWFMLGLVNSLSIITGVSGKERDRSESMCPEFGTFNR